MRVSHEAARAARMDGLVAAMAGAGRQAALARSARSSVRETSGGSRRQHVAMRAAERFGLTMSHRDCVALDTLIASGEACLVGALFGQRLVSLVRFRGVVMAAVHEADGRAVTVLTACEGGRLVRRVAIAAALGERSE